MTKKKKGKVINMNRGGQSQGDQPEMPRMQIDLRAIESETCKNCGGIFFEVVSMFKIIPAVKSPTGKDYPQEIPFVRCVNCNELHEKLSPMDLL